MLTNAAYTSNVILYLSGNGEGDVAYAEQILQPQLKAFPKVFYSRNLAYL